ncbi:glutamate racemase [Parvicella tangerina]|uniref:Glutamate racemase n=1 Tax=Parvicella tangerina TaxID=2829795 RepID=A0A916JMC6_9FLAO|nr:hypothetical protein [Parvicella tangerina]CAG5080408.1 Glutamate racemase [Parvicella tangerina]
MKIGICDWGIGGLGLVKAMQDREVAGDIVYFSDAGYTPYGKVDEALLRKRWNQVKGFLRGQGAEQIVVACNALSTVVENEKKVITVGNAVKSIIKEYSRSRLAILGGFRTIESKIYDFGFKGHTGWVAQPLSALVERGVLEGPEVIEEVHRIINQIGQVEVIVLACTHYPALMPVLKELYPDTKFIDPTERLLSDVTELSIQHGELTCYTTGNTTQMMASTQKAWGMVLHKVSQIELTLQ